MIASSPLIKALACCGAVAAHAALAVVLLPEPPLATEGAGGVAEVRLGTAFADVSAGTLQARPATAAARPATRTKARQLAPPPEIAKAKTPPRASSTPPAARALPAAPSPAAPEPLRTATPSMAAPPAAPAAEAPRPTVVPDAPPQETVVYTDPDSARPRRSLRPRQRSTAFEAEHRAEPRRDARQPARAAPPKAGGPPKRAGAATGTAGAKAQSSGRGQKSPTAGNAAASNYPGQVMRRVAQVGRVRANASGAAVVAFTISSSGRLAALSLAKSSGNADLDRAALRQIRRAVPFPKPPAGAQRSFRITIQGR